MGINDAPSISLARDHLRSRLLRGPAPQTATRLLLIHLEEYRHITTLDISAGYHQTRLHLNDESITAIVNDENNAEPPEPPEQHDDVDETVPALFTDVNMCVHLDDLIIHTNDSIPNHAEVVNEICTRLQAFGLQLNRPSERSSSGDPPTEN